jgi:GAF domain-containing protein
MKEGKPQYSAIDAALVEELARQAGLAIARLRS